ncbi:hypothetical protein [Streptomyces sp. KL116D]
MRATNSPTPQGSWKPGRAQVAFYSTQTDRLMRGEELDASYWYRNLR